MSDISYHMVNALRGHFNPNWRPRDCLWRLRFWRK